MWAYNGQTEAGEGCWDRFVCSGDNGSQGSWLMFDERQIQWFCSDDQMRGAAMAGNEAPFGLAAADAPHFDAWADSCTSDADCSGDDQ